jgi:hypothetical protein
MARMPALVRALAETTSRDRPSLDHVVSEGRRAGILSRTKKGFGASPINVTDAANLLIAAFGMDSPRQAGELVPQYRSLRRWGDHEPTPMHRYRIAAAAAGDDVFALLDRAADFGEALETLIREAPKFGHAMFAAVHSETSEQGKAQRNNAMVWSLHHFRVAFRRFPAIAIIRLEVSPAIEWVFYPDPDLRDRGFYAEPSGDDQTETSIGFRTLLTIAANILEPPDDEAAADILAESEPE